MSQLPPPRYEPKFGKPWYDRLALLRTTYPTATNEELAGILNVSKEYISSITCSAMYRDLEAKHLQEFNASVRGALESQLTGVASKSLDLIMGKLNTPVDIALPELRETASMALKSLGFGAAAASSPNNTNVFLVGQDTLASAREIIEGVYLPAPAVEEPSEEENEVLP